MYGYYKIKNLKFKKGTVQFKPISSMNDNGVLNWNNESIDELYIDSELLKYTIENYGLISFDVEKALLSESYKMGKDIFGRYVSVLFEEKAKQDELKGKKDSDYNPALREVIKLFLNSVSGKLVEDPSHYKSFVFCNNADKHLNGTSIAQEENNEINLWVGCGVMVYSYSKRNLFEYIRHLPNNSDDVIHVETDGIYFDAGKIESLKCNINEYKGEYPVAIGGKLGNIKIEHISQGVSYWLGKKFYYMYDDEDIMKIKGIPLTTIDSYGNRVKLVDKQLYENVFNWKDGDLPIMKHFSTLRKQLWGRTMISSHYMSRTITPNMKYKTYSGG